jgi:hypothetical protein
MSGPQLSDLALRGMHCSKDRVNATKSKIINQTAMRDYFLLLQLAADIRRGILAA